jgi:hypothetical protein
MRNESWVEEDLNLSDDKVSRGRRVLRIFMICTAPDIIKIVKYRILRRAKRVEHLGGMGSIPKNCGREN